MGLRHLLGLHSLTKIGSARLHTLMAYFGEYEAAWENFDEWRQVLGNGIDYEEIRRERRAVDLTALYEKFLLSDSKLITVDDAAYPKRLLNIPEPPYALFYRGELPADDDTAVAIVGSRRATAYGKEAAAYFANGLAQSGAWVIGGMARGIDSAAHRAALDAGGKTVGVLGCGIDVVYPPENRQLFADAIQNGCIISEYPLGTPPLAMNFPMRNRVISGLSQAVLVVEAGMKSGTQITVDYAKVQKRRIYAVPGSIFSVASVGTLRLIKNGVADVAASAKDILDDLAQEAARTPSEPEQLSFEIAPAARPLPDDPLERKIVEFVTEQKHFNDIARELSINAADLAGTLTLLEISGFIKRLDGQYYIRSES